jgi:hypothetical protein
LATLPMEWTLCQFSNIFAPSPRETNALRPRPRNQVGFASRFCCRGLVCQWGAQETLGAEFERGRDALFWH